MQFQWLGQFVVNDALPGKRTVDRTRHVWRVIFGRRGVSSRDRRVRLGVITPEAELQDERLHVSGDLPTLQHELAGRRPEGRSESVHAAVEGCGVKPELGHPVCDQCSFPVAVGAWKFQSNLTPQVADGLGDGVGAGEVVHELFLVVVDEVSGPIVALGYVEWLKLAAAGATKGKPNQDVGFETTRLDKVHDRAEGVSIHDVIAQGDANNQAVRVMVGQLAKGRGFTTANLN